MKKAVDRATPDLYKLEQLKKEKNYLDEQLKKVISQKNNIVDAVSDGLLKKNEVEEKINKLREQETDITSRLTIVNNEISSMPDADNVKRLSKLDYYHPRHFLNI